MNTKIVDVTRRSKIGFGYSCTVHNNEFGHWELDDVEKPDYIGTYKKVQDAIKDDKFLQSLESGGTYYTTCWFVKVNGKWYKMVTEDNEWIYSLEFDKVARVVVREI